MRIFWAKKEDLHQGELFLVQDSGLVDIGQLPNMGQVLLRKACRHEYRTNIHSVHETIGICVTGRELGSTAKFVDRPLIRRGSEAVRGSAGLEINVYRLKCLNRGI